MGSTACEEPVPRSTYRKPPLTTTHHRVAFRPTVLVIKCICTREPGSLSAGREAKLAL
jgi:hypothetical protein